MGRMLTELTGLTDRVSFQHGDALNMPFQDASFNVVWMQNATMNLPDKPRLFREIHRVLRPGGCLAMQDILAGPVQPIHFPVAWAHDASMSFLRTESDTRAMLAGAGLREVGWKQVAEGAPGSGLRSTSRAVTLVRAEDGDVARENGARNTAEGRVIAVWAVADRD